MKDLVKIIAAGVAFFGLAQGSTMAAAPQPDAGRLMIRGDVSEPAGRGLRMEYAAKEKKPTSSKREIPVSDGQPRSAKPPKPRR